MFIAASKRLGFDEHFYGLGEKAARLDKRRGFFVNWNADTPGYTEGKDPIYQTIPFYVGLQNGAAYGIFFDNSYRSYFDFGRSSQQRAWFGAEGGEMNYYFFYGPSIKKILSRYADLTGHMPLPPMWALGNQQSRWSYYPEKMVEEVVREYRERDLPLDVIHLDIDYMQGYRVFTLAISLLTSLVFGLVPAIDASRQVSSCAQPSPPECFGTYCMVHHSGRLERVNPGFNPENLLTLEIELPEGSYGITPTTV